MTKPKPGILELEGIYDKVTENFHRIVILDDQKRIRGRIYISKDRPVPTRIVITVKRKGGEQKCQAESM